MSRKLLIAGNWKMNGLLADGAALAKGVAEEVKKMGKVDCEFLATSRVFHLPSVRRG